MRQTCQQNGRTCVWTEGRETVNESNRCAVYARYSSEKQNALSIDQQIRKCRECAQREGLQVIEECIFTDEAITGATDNRAGLPSLSVGRSR